MAAQAPCLGRNPGLVLALSRLLCGHKSCPSSLCPHLCGAGDLGVYSYTPSVYAESCFCPRINQHQVKSSARKQEVETFN